MTSGARFAALHDRRTRGYLVGAGLAMMGDAIEHVITYWVLWQTFASPTLVGFQAISHWLPFLVLSVWFGRLAGHLGPARMIVSAQALFLFVSVAWGVLFATGTLQLWHACVLLVLHGVAGAAWGPAEQLALHRLVPSDALTGAVRLNATFRTGGILAAPLVGAALLSFVGPTVGIFLNALCYLPLIVVVARARVLAPAEPGQPARVSREDRRAVRVAILSRPALWGAIAVSSLVAATVGGMMPVSMATLAETLAATGFGYGALVFAGGLGALLSGITLEAVSRGRPRLATAVIAAAGLAVCAATAFLSPVYAVVLVALFLGGACDMVTSTTGVAIAQLEAPERLRGPVFGVFGMFGNGFRLFGGAAIALGGTWLSIPHVVAAAAGVLLVGVFALAVAVRRSDGTRS